MVCCLRFNKIFYILSLWICLPFYTKSVKISKDVIGFPEVEENVLLINKQNRSPVYVPSLCRENELYYPGDQKDDWICDCRPAYLYHPATDACWLAYRRGPCQIDEQLILYPLSSVIPICKKNPCSDGFVLWRGRCEALNSVAPCKEGNGQKFSQSTLWINATTLAVDCVPIDFNKRTSPEIGAGCLPGCKRSIENKCIATIT